MPRPQLDFWFDFASTYSYPAMMRIAGLARAAGVAVRYRPFLLGPIFKAHGWDNSPFNLYPAKGRYMWRDMERLCAGQSIPFLRPDAFPQPSILAARMALVGLEAGHGEEFCRAVFHAEFAEQKRIDDPETLTAILSQLRVDSGAALATARTDAIKNRLRAETAEAQQRGIFGAPSFVTPDGELFWGNDRLESAIEWTRRVG